MSAEEDAVARLRSPATVRARAERLFALAQAGELEHFRLDLDRMDDVAAAVAAEVRETYPDLQVPYHSRWRHFDPPRTKRLDEAMQAMDEAERARCRFDLVVTSVLLDAGAGPDWSYQGADRVRWSRSEGLAVASFDWFMDGGFSSDASRPLRADAAGLRAVTGESLTRAFQASAENPLVGIEGRAQLMNALGDALLAAPDLFGESPARIGGLYDVLRADAAGGQVRAADVLERVLRGLSSIWPGRVEVGGENLGDVWPHPALDEGGLGGDLMPFHKLSQWLTYSLLEPLEWAGLTVVGLDELTGLAEYRNGGLLVDLGVLVLRDPAARSARHAPGSPLVVEWRALTLALLDRVADAVRTKLGVDAASFPLAKVLQGGTWSAGRRAARERRPDGSPPLRIDSDGTVF